MAFADALREGDTVATADRPSGNREKATRGRILVVDDDRAALTALELLLRADGFSTWTAPDGESALVEVEQARPDVVLTDLQMAPMPGVELCRVLHEMDRELPVVVMTGHSDMQSALESLRVGAEDYLIKPLEAEAVRMCLDRAIARRAARLAEQRQRGQVNALLGELNEGVVIADPKGRVLMINGAARSMLCAGDVEPSTIDALHAWEIQDLAGRRLPPARRPLARALRGETFTEYETLIMRPNGEPLRVAATGTSVNDDDGRVAQAIVVFRDVTAPRRAERQLEEYVALVSHDLRSPLSSILLFVSTLKQSMARHGVADGVNLAERVERNVWRMSTMLEELTEAAKLESHGVSPERTVCDLVELVTEVVDGLDEASARRISIEAYGPPYPVLADASRLQRVVANLLANALKYSPPDAPVRARLARTESVVVLDVIDKGIGIAPENIGMLFERYYRTKSARAHAGGLGLGLYIARLVVEAHGGQIEVSSAMGEGSTFRVTLPRH
jgi:two-component system, NtrC family, sensor histidine kinase KinB